jgi:dihydrofolate reductase
MTVISLVYAQSRNGVIGDAGGLPWHIPSDLKRFKQTTLGKPTVMGRKTWDSLPRKPLPGRMNIVITRQAGFVAEGAVVAATVADAIRVAGDVAEVCVIGGGEIYQQFLPHASRVYLTEIDLVVDGDTPAPRLDPDEWHEISATVHARGESDSAGFVTRVLERRHMTPG